MKKFELPKIEVVKIEDIITNQLDEGASLEEL